MTPWISPRGGCGRFSAFVANFFFGDLGKLIEGRHPAATGVDRRR
jgi:hypothetical protein